MPHVIHVRDVVRRSTYTLGPEVEALRVPYDMFHPAGSVTRHDSDVEWIEGKDVRRARFTATPLGDCHPGERVLLSLAPRTSEDEWWLCDVEAVDDVPAG
jgi:hypothetical protein